MEPMRPKSSDQLTASSAIILQPESSFYLLLDLPSTISLPSPVVLPCLHINSFGTRPFPLSEQHPHHAVDFNLRKITAACACTSHRDPDCSREDPNSWLCGKHNRPSGHRKAVKGGSFAQAQPHDVPRTALNRCRIIIRRAIDPTTASRHTNRRLDKSACRALLHNALSRSRRRRDQSRASSWR